MYYKKPIETDLEAEKFLGIDLGLGNLIRYVEQEESYTSKTSFFDNNALPTYNATNEQKTNPNELEFFNCWKSPPSVVGMFTYWGFLTVNFFRKILDLMSPIMLS